MSINFRPPKKVSDNFRPPEKVSDKFQLLSIRSNKDPKCLITYGSPRCLLDKVCHRGINPFLPLILTECALIHVLSDSIFFSALPLGQGRLTSWILTKINLASSSSRLCQPLPTWRLDSKCGFWGVLSPSCGHRDYAGCHGNLWQPWRPLGNSI